MLFFAVINGEKAAFNTPVFAQKRERTMDMLIKNLYQEYIVDNGKNTMLNKRAFSDIKPELVTGSRRKEEARQMEFLRIGQVTKCFIQQKSGMSSQLCGYKIDIILCSLANMILFLNYPQPPFFITTIVHQVWGFGSLGIITVSALTFL